MICAVGQELRDYPTLVEAVAGPRRRRRGRRRQPVVEASRHVGRPRHPRQREVAGFNLFDLRQLYADASFVVVPLQETDFQAGITTILEAMSMGKAVVCTRTTGQTDTIVDGETGSTCRRATSARCGQRSSGCSPTRLAADRAGQRWVRDGHRVYAARRRRH